MRNFCSKKNTDNRPVNKSAVERYARDMKSLAWRQDTGETIKIAKDGSILDGQHRLEGVIKAGVGIYFWIATGLDKGVFAVIDTGKMRTGRDVFFVKKVKNYGSIPAIISQYKVLDSKQMTSQHSTSVNLTNTSLINEYDSRPEFWDEIAHRAGSLYEAFSKILSKGMIGGFLAHLSEKSEIHANEFITQVCTGEGITNRVILLLRNRLIADVADRTKSIDKLTKVALIVKAWNAYRTGTYVRQLKYTRDKEGYIEAI